MKSPHFKIGLGFLLLAIVLGGGFAGWWYVHRAKSKPDIHKVGGVVLVYEVDDATLTPDYQPSEMVGAVQRRLDGAGFTYVTVLTATDKRIEIQVPRRMGEPDADIDTLKKLIAQQGRLEFVIAANQMDDRAAIEDARQHLTDSANKAELEQAARAGDRPPVFVGMKGKPTTYLVNLDGEATRHTYAWAKISKAALASLRLNQALREKVSQSLDREPVELFDGTLLYGRTVPATRRQSGSEEDGEFEHFVLLREAEWGKEITGDLLKAVDPGIDPLGKPEVLFEFTARGGNLFWDLTTKNRPSGSDVLDHHRFIAVVLDRQILTMPRLNSPIRNYGHITGNFTRAEVFSIVAILRAGALPAQLRPIPLSETTIEPK